MRKINVSDITLAAVVAALYAVLSYFAGIFGLTYGPVQCRFSEALCVLPFFFPNIGWGLFAGCLLTNLMSAYGPLDIIFGSLATLIAAIATSKVKNKWLAPLPPVIANGVIVSAVIAYSEAGSAGAFLPLWAYNAATIAVGEAVACYGLGMILIYTLPKIGFFRKRIQEVNSQTK